MRQYVIDQLREFDYNELLKYFNENADSTVMGGLYWAELPRELYTEVQAEHGDCQPFYFAVNLNFKQIAFEWLIRSRNTVHCNCFGYATPKQRDYIIDFANGVLRRLNLQL